MQTKNSEHAVLVHTFGELYWAKQLIIIHAERHINCKFVMINTNQNETLMVLLIWLHIDADAEEPIRLDERCEIRVCLPLFNMLEKGGHVWDRGGKTSPGWLVDLLINVGLGNGIRRKPVWAKVCWGDKSFRKTKRGMTDGGEWKGWGGGDDVEDEENGDVTKSDERLTDDWGRIFDWKRLGSVQKRAGVDTPKNPLGESRESGDRDLRVVPYTSIVSCVWFSLPLYILSYLSLPSVNSLSLSLSFSSSSSQLRESIRMFSL